MIVPKPTGAVLDYLRPEFNSIFRPARAFTAKTISGASTRPLETIKFWNIVSPITSKICPLHSCNLFVGDAFGPVQEYIVSPSYVTSLSDRLVLHRYQLITVAELFEYESNPKKDFFTPITNLVAPLLPYFIRDKFKSLV